MSGEPEIEQWVEDQGFVIEEGENPFTVFERIDKIFLKDGRLPLADILGEQLPQFMEYIERRTRTTRADIEIAESEGLIASVTKFLRGLFR